MIKRLVRNPLQDVPEPMRAGARREADMDLLARLSAGTVVYPAMLLLVGLTTPYRADHPYLFWPLVGITVLALAMRLAVRKARERLYARGRNWFILPLLFSVGMSGGTAGFLLVTVAMKYGFSSFAFAVTMMWMAGIASGSTISFKPSLTFLLVQLAVVLVPVTAYELLLGTSHGWSLAIATLVYLGFHVVQGVRLNAMYWDLCVSRVVETVRMKELEAAKSMAEQAQEQLRFQATHDPLTGVLNHGQILSVFDRELDRAVRSGIPLGLLMLDLDHFKQVNDEFGHLAGDEVLRVVTARVRETLRSYDSVGRYGGEEFLIVLPNCGMEDCAATADRIRQAVESEPVVHEHARIRVTASLGVTVLAPDTDILHRHMIARADKALYRAKKMGRNRVELESFEPRRAAEVVEGALEPA